MQELYKALYSGGMGNSGMPAFQESAAPAPAPMLPPGAGSSLYQALVSSNGEEAQPASDKDKELWRIKAKEALIRGGKQAFGGAQDVGT